MDKEMMGKIQEMLKARGKRELSPEETEAVVGGAPETFVWCGTTVTRMEFIGYVEDIRRAYGNDVAIDILLDGIRSMNYYHYPDSHIIELFRTYGANEGFWAMMDRVGF